MEFSTYNLNMEKSEDLSEEWQIVSTLYDNGQETNVDEKTSLDSSKTAEDSAQRSISGIQDVDPGNAVLHDSSSSDIELIDETEENTTSCVLPSSSLSISATIDKTSESCSEEISISSSAVSNIVVPQIESNNDHNTEDSERNEEQPDNQNDDYSETSWTIGGRTIYDWLMLLLQYLENMNSDQWWTIGMTVTLCLSVCFTFNVTNIFANDEKGNVVSQMKEMIEELKNDNKLLRDQMMSEMKNDKMLTSFEHQIRELKKENSKLNHMLFDVVKVLEEQKDSQEKLLGKKESEFLAPFKKEINKLKEHINILKFDNEELQKQLVRMRYASYSQGGKHTDESKMHEKDKKENKADKTKNDESEIPVDLKYLKKWNELIDMLANQLGVSDLKNFQNPHDGTKKKDWGWNSLKSNLKGTFDNLNNINISDLLSKYFKYNEKAMSDIYKSVSNYFNGAQQNVQQFYDSFNNEDATLHTEQNKNIWDTLKDLSGKWAEMKNKFYSSYLRKSFPIKTGFRKPSTSEDTREYFDAKTADKKDQTEETVDFSKGKHLVTQRVSIDPEQKDWQFERAAHRAELRESEEESSVNWFLKKGKEEEKNTHEDDSSKKYKWSFEF